MITKITEWVKSHAYDFFLAGVVVLIGVIGYNFGRMQSGRKPELKVGQDAAVFNGLSGDQAAGGRESLAPDTHQTQPTKPAAKSTASTATATPKPTISSPSDQRVVVSKTSTSKKYHYASCPGAKQIKPENQIWFESAQAAEVKGYTLAGNCKP